MRGFGRMTLLLAAIGLLLALPGALAAVVPLPMDDSGGLPPDPAGYSGPFSYEDPSIKVDISEGRVNNTDYWVGRVTIQHPSQLRTVSAGGWDSGRTTSGMALFRRVDAVMAINGDYFSYIHNGYLIRQGKLYRDLPGGMRDVLLIDEQGDFHLALMADRESILPYKEMKIANAFNFGPALVVGGERVTRFFDVDNAAKKSRQRMAIAQVETGRLEYVVVACSGPSGRSQGMTLDEFSRLVHEQGVENAYNLDGGNSTMLMFGGAFVNAKLEPTMRPISDIVYFASAWQPEGE